MGTLKYSNELDLTFMDEFSFKDFTKKSLRNENIPNSINIYASCFSQEEPDSLVFPDGMTGVMFYNCNLDNCYIPPGNTVIGGNNRRFKVQNDNDDWIINELNEPTEPVNKYYRLSLSMSIDPKDIPTNKVIA